MCQLQWMREMFVPKIDLHSCVSGHLCLQGDVWAESRMLGFLWHYFACMEGKVYDITEWASCQVSTVSCCSHANMCELAANSFGIAETPRICANSAAVCSPPNCFSCWGQEIAIGFLRSDLWSFSKSFSGPFGGVRFCFREWTSQFRRWF